MSSRRSWQNSCSSCFKNFVAKNTSDLLVMPSWSSVMSRTGGSIPGFKSSTLHLCIFREG